MSMPSSEIVFWGWALQKYVNIFVCTHIWRALLLNPIYKLGIEILNPFVRTDFNSSVKAWILNYIDITDYYANLLSTTLCTQRSSAYYALTSRHILNCRKSQPVSYGVWKSWNYQIYCSWVEIMEFELLLHFYRLKHSLHLYKRAGVFKSNLWVLMLMWRAAWLCKVTENIMRNWMFVSS